MTDMDTSVSLGPPTSSHPTLATDDSNAFHEENQHSFSTTDHLQDSSQDPNTNQENQQDQHQNQENQESLLSLSQERLVILSDQELQEKHELDFKSLQFKQKQELIALLTDKSKASESYYKNSKKEDLALAYAANFNRQYGNLYPGRKELLLSPPNEFSINVG
jgi:hypothetical protein